MNKTILPILAMLIIFGCDKETINPIVVEDIGTISDRGSNKIAVCHNGKIKFFNTNAIAAHQNHGDAIDFDSDGYFDAPSPCSSEVDCDDNDPNVNPSAIEDCSNGIDDDCDGNIDSADDDCGCVPGEIEVTIFDGSVVYVYPTDKSSSTAWGTPGGIPGVTPISSSINATFDAAGESNTAAIVAHYGSYNGGDYAANICAELATQTGCDWYLPAFGELNSIASELSLGTAYWSSTPDMFLNAHVLTPPSTFNAVNRQFGRRACRCIRR